MRFHVDVQIHSKYSRATSRDADLEHMALWGQKKGVAIVGTGDFTHPAWLAQIKEKLVPAEPGLFRLRPEIEREVERLAPAAGSEPTRFMLEVEISTIYKKGDKVRKIHHLIFVPDLAAADRLVASLSRIGNLASDGRPILGLDSRDLLEIALESGPDSYLIPAHIWTPWFAALGSKSGFDSIDDCYGDLAPHIFAVETGLSSDPEMNWRISSLDRFRLVSNSDAHSPPKIGREATTYDTALDYFAISNALKTGDGFVGTVEFFPEEGKYHMDGHRKCEVRLTPEETKALGGRCPVCGGPITVGVLHRVDALADRPTEGLVPPATAGIFQNLVPLPEILAEIEGVGTGSKVVAAAYERLLARLGPEIAILEAVPAQDVAQAAGPLLAEAVTRLRAGKVIREAGYDGEYGVIRLFEPHELGKKRGGGLFTDLPATAKAAPIPARAPGLAETPQTEATPDLPPAPASTESGPLAGLDAAQRAAAATTDGPLVIVAGPGSGKTRTLTHRIAHLVADLGVAPDACLAVTFTRRAAEEMRERLAALLPDAGAAVPVHTFHSLGLAILREHPASAGLTANFRVADEAARAAMLAVALDVSAAKARSLLRTISLAKRTALRDAPLRVAPQDEGNRTPHPEEPAFQGPHPEPGRNGPSRRMGNPHDVLQGETAAAMIAYGRALAERGWVDFDDLVGLAVTALEADPALAESYRARFRWISVDEFQDVDAMQYRLVRLLAPPGANLCVIGDANQAIYGFRGADAACFAHFTEDYPRARAVRLDVNYRSSGAIVAASSQVIAEAAGDDAAGRAVRAMQDRLTLHAARSEAAEAEFVVQAIEGLLGGHSFFSIDSGRGTAGRSAELSFADFAVLYRTDAQADALVEAFARSGMPFARHGHAPLAEATGVAALRAALGVDDGTMPLAARLKQAVATLAPEASPSPAVVAQLVALAEANGGDAARFADALALASEADGWDPRADRVSLLTLHAAKGLEFPVVFIVGLEDGILPLRWGGGDPDDDQARAARDEERRLFYVGMTRARDRLFLCRAEKRLWRGTARALPPSPFLARIEAALTEQSRQAARPRKPEDRQLDLF